DLRSRCGNRSWGANLIYSPSEPELEEETVNVYLRQGGRRGSVSAFMKLRPGVVRYSATGLRMRTDGSILRRNHVFAKVSRPEVARHFLSPAPDAILDHLVANRSITAEEAR